eukprot:TRINITY_DN7455_c0_g3_i1.p1 TRINITY_DN7455_c0_g3~~TRINITY_DN7455_c0_g3_i1.p1  ORF type:complete len:502 (+),score=57.47 TRINITY_DN7455_c0_g3_i1:71-1576(+)
MLEMRHCLLLLVASMSAFSATRVRTLVDSRNELDLAGLWFERRRVMGMGILASRFFDIVKINEGRFQAFPITECTPDGSWFDWMGLAYVSCEDDIVISITLSNASVGSSHVATKTSRSGTVTATLSEHGQKELQWSDGTQWELHNEATTILDDWDDEECRALSGAASNDPIAYEVFGGTSASLELRHIPGITLDVFICVQNDWLHKHQARFECVLEKASKSNETDGTRRKEMLAKALGRLREVMPKDENSVCAPSVCIGISATKFPIPSPIPSVSLFVSWPAEHDECNGASIRDAIDDVQQERKSAETAVEELNASAFHGFHGSSISVFPVPNVAYFAMGTLHSSAVLTGREATEKLAEEGQKAFAKIESLITDAINACPAVQKRFQYHSLSDDVKASLAQSRSAGETLRIVAKSFPELSSVAEHQGTRLGFGVGSYFQVGVLGVSAGLFGGGSFKHQALGNRYEGCPEWSELIKLWYDSPLASADPEDTVVSNVQESHNE